MPSGNAFRPTAATTNASATTTSTAAAQLTLPSPTDPTVQVRVHNAGSVAVFVVFGASAVGAATTAAGMPIPAGGVEVFSLAGDQTYHRVITASGTATVYFTVGEGV